MPYSSIPKKCWFVTFALFIEIFFRCLLKIHLILSMKFLSKLLVYTEKSNCELFNNLRHVSIENLFLVAVEGFNHVVPFKGSFPYFAWRPLNSPHPQLILKALS